MTKAASRPRWGMDAHGYPADAHAHIRGRGVRVLPKSAAGHWRKPTLNHLLHMATLGHVPSQLDGDDHSGQQIVQMGPGQGEDSYMKNSWVQSHILHGVEAPLWQGIRSASRVPEMGNAGKALRVADLGCATGDNTLQAVEKLLESLAALWESHCNSHGQLQPFPKDVEVFFNDLASNDFNTLFRSLPPHNSNSNCNSKSSRSYLAAGVPGSFHGALFPAASMHAFTCFSALHWLSRIPPEVLDKNSPAFNSDRIHVGGDNPAVDGAFADQSFKDLTAFLTNRSNELVPGGFLALAWAAKPDDEQPLRLKRLDLLEDAFHDLAAKGVIPPGVIDTFNIPVYYPSIAQVRRAVEDVGHFDIHLLRFCGDVSLYPPHKCEEYRADLRKFARQTCLTLKSLFRKSMEEHLGAELSNLVFQQYEHHVQTLDLEPGRNVTDYFTVTYAVALLTRK